ncbi:hypothetical protein NECID01_1199 [Nematocida sp. AWRm77]|nr:hypothetical protein NECID01_1199 [Nematocida sp. AWRm77]
MKIKNIGDGLEKKPTAPIEGQRSPNSADLGSSPEKPKSDVGSSNGTAIKNNSKNSIEAKPKSRWEELQPKLIIALCVSMTISVLLLSMSSLFILNIYCKGLLTDSGKAYRIYGLRSNMVAMLHRILIGYIACLAINYIGYVGKYAKKTRFHCLLYFLVFIPTFGFGAYIATVLLNVEYFSSLWVLSLTSLCIMLGILVLWKVHVFRLLPPSYAEFIKIVPWEVIWAFGLVLFACVFSYVDLAYKYGDVKLDVIRSKLDNLVKKNFTQYLAGK